MPPAARLSDFHVCPMLTGPVPHVGGPVIAAGVTCVTQMLPQAVATDKAICVGPPDVIVKGSMTVMVGGKPAARLGDNCAHGGTIMLGCFTVMIGG